METRQEMTQRPTRAARLRQQQVQAQAQAPQPRADTATLAQVLTAVNEMRGDMADLHDEVSDLRAKVAMKDDLTKLLPRETADLQHAQVMTIIGTLQAQYTDLTRKVDTLQGDFHTFQLADARASGQVQTATQAQINQTASTAQQGIAQARTSIDEAINKALMVLVGAMASGLVAALLALAHRP